MSDPAFDALPDPIMATLADLPAAVAAAVIDPEPGVRLTIDSAGIPFSVLTWGDPTDRPLVLIHGVTASAAIWWRVGPSLAATGRRVLALDLPGHGRTGHWTGRQRFPDMAVDVAAFIRASGADRPDLQVVGHSYGAMTTANLPTAGLRPSTLILLDPPALPLALMATMVEDADGRTYDDLDEAIAAVAAENPEWSPGDIRASAEALTDLDETAARAILLDNGDWDGGLSGLEALAGLADVPAQRVDVWLLKGEQATGSYLPDTAIPAFVARLGAGHILTVKDGAHSPQRMRLEATLVALLRALD